MTLLPRLRQGLILLVSTVAIGMVSSPIFPLEGQYRRTKGCRVCHRTRLSVSGGLNSPSERNWMIDLRLSVDRIGIRGVLVTVKRALGPVQKIERDAGGRESD